MDGVGVAAGVDEFDAQVVTLDTAQGGAGTLAHQPPGAARGGRGHGAIDPAGKHHPRRDLEFAVDGVHAPGAHRPAVFLAHYAIVEVGQNLVGVEAVGGVVHLADGSHATMGE